MEGNRIWLDLYFAGQQRGLVESWFADTVRSMPEETNLNKLCSALARRLAMDRQDQGPGRLIDQETVIRAMKADPDGARGTMQYFIDQEARSPEEKAADQEKEKERGKQRHMEALPPTRAQMDLLIKLGVDVMPDNRWHASRLIDEAKTW